VTLRCAQIPIDIRQGITDEQANAVVDGLKVKGDKGAAAKQIKALYKLFVEADCTMVEASRLCLGCAAGSGAGAILASSSCFSRVKC
jgi:succinyl-CoA synthetase beta subunit